ncbi:hypothetical protein EYR40_001584 [Pleurotus pulmonarius]|nr:hypothetical protein EYR38_004827 [Pleurotus pulmonarius]KAF4609231.1 hypothetical protein EYR40_001584 [Pleurotus pulmonarius]
MRRVLSARNITIDDNSSLIRYEGKWHRSPQNVFSFGGTYASSTDALIANAIFTFTGTGVYFMSPLWSIPVAVTLTLDSRPSEVVYLQTMNSLPATSWGTERSTPIWGISGLENGTHNVVVTYGTPRNVTQAALPFIVVDAFIYTVEEESTPPSTTTSIIAAPYSSPSILLIGGLLGTLAGVGLIAGLTFFILWRQKRAGDLRTKHIEPFYTLRYEVHQNTLARRAFTPLPPKHPPAAVSHNNTSSSSAPTGFGSSLPPEAEINMYSSESSESTIPTAASANHLRSGGISPPWLAPPPPYDQH